MTDLEMIKDWKTLSEIEANMLIVDITRTVKQCYLISNKSFCGKFRSISNFLGRLESNDVETIPVDVNYLKRQN